MGCLFTRRQAGEDLSNSSSFPTAGSESAVKPELVSSLSPPELSASCQSYTFLPRDTESLQNIQCLYLPWVKKNNSEKNPSDLFLISKLALSSSVYTSTTHLATMS